MKFKITFKDPDGFGDSMQNAVEESLSKITGLTEPEMNSLMEKRYEDIAQVVAKWVRWQEYVTIEIDTEAKTATVMEAH